MTLFWKTEICALTLVQEIDIRNQSLGIRNFSDLCDSGFMLQFVYSYFSYLSGYRKNIAHYLIMHVVVAITKLILVLRYVLCLKSNSNMTAIKVKV